MLDRLAPEALRTKGMPLVDWSDAAAAIAEPPRQGDALVVVAHVGWPAARALVACPPCPDHERERAARFHRAIDREQFLLARGLVRTLCARWFGEAPAALAFGAPDHRKPTLRPGCGLDVSIAHSAGWVACGFARGLDIGIDLEEDDGRRDVAALAARVLTPRENDAMQPGDEARARAFFHAAWRRKEAVLKAAGLGLAGDPARVETLAANGRSADRAIFADHVTFAGEIWSLRAIDAPDRPEIAVATAARGTRR